MTSREVSVEIDDHVAIVEIHRPPNNFFDAHLIRAIADAYHQLDDDLGCRAIVLCAEGKHFCAGADFSGPTGDAKELYAQAIRLFHVRKPAVAAEASSTAPCACANDTGSSSWPRSALTFEPTREIYARCSSGSRSSSKRTVPR